jgi:hypothetical protein
MVKSGRVKALNPFLNSLGKYGLTVLFIVK